MYQMDETVRVYLAVILILCSPMASSKELSEDQAFVLIDVKAETLRNIRFGEMSSSDTIRVSAIKSSKRITRAGNYYLKGLESAYVNIRPVQYEPPLSDEGKIVIEPRTTNYLGAWKFRDEFTYNLKYHREVSFDLEILRQFVKRDPSLTKYPLRVVTDMGVVQKLSWDSVLTRQSDE